MRFVWFLLVILSFSLFLFVFLFLLVGLSIHGGWVWDMSYGDMCLCGLVVIEGFIREAGGTLY